MSRFIFQIGHVPVARTTVGAAAVEELADFNYGRVYMYLENEDAADMYIGFGTKTTTTASFTDDSDMIIIKAGDSLHFSDGAIPTGKIYVYSLGGGNIKFGQHPDK